MENTLENKAKFFAQYYNQHVLYFTQSFLRKVDHLVLSHVEDSDYLELKPLSSITDEEHKEILENPIYNTEKSVQKNKIGNYYTSDIAITDYLRSKGYALPFMGISVKKLVEFGWIKIKN